MKLTRLNIYSREEVNKIFNPGVKFKAGTGTWGMHGLIRVPRRKNDFIFYVTLGQDKSGYEFDESITSGGQLKWQSQPKQTFDDERIQRLINHNEETSHIYLFIRKGTDQKKFLYLGNLAYVSHDEIKEAPVHFIWQIVEWDDKAKAN